MLATSRYRSRRYDPPAHRPSVPLRLIVRTGLVPEGAAGATPLKPTPTLVTKQDLTDYAGLLLPMIKGLNGDLLANTIYMDPDVEHDALEADLLQAKAWDGCDTGLLCPGWRDTDPEPSALDIGATKARALRRSAFQHSVNARFMEDRIKERGLTNAQIPPEVALWHEWLDYRQRFDANLQTIDKVDLVKPSDFENMQQLDLQLQAYRARYRALTGKAPSTPVPPPTPTAKAWYETLPIKEALLVAGLFGVGYVLHEVRR